MCYGCGVLKCKIKTGKFAKPQLFLIRICNMAHYNKQLLRKLHYCGYWVNLSTIINSLRCAPFVAFRFLKIIVSCSNVQDIFVKECDDKWDESHSRKRGVCGKKAVCCIKFMVFCHVSCLSRKNWVKVGETINYREREKGLSAQNISK